MSPWLPMMGIGIALCVTSCSSVTGSEASTDTGSSDGTETDTSPASAGPMDSSGGEVDSEPIPLVSNPQVDILFVVDDSGSMGPVQAKLAAGMESFMAVLGARGATTSTIASR